MFGGPLSNVSLFDEDVCANQEHEAERTRHTTAAPALISATQQPAEVASDSVAPVMESTAAVEVGAPDEEVWLPNLCEKLVPDENWKTSKGLLWAIMEFMVDIDSHAQNELQT